MVWAGRGLGVRVGSCLAAKLVALDDGSMDGDGGIKEVKLVCLLEPGAEAALGKGRVTGRGRVAGEGKIGPTLRWRVPGDALSKPASQQAP